jgi:ABC-2 type transport system ATP-binding protein
MTTPVLSVTDVAVRYGRHAAPVVAGLSFDVAAGEVFGLLGANGCGKSSTLAAVAGALEPAAGSVRVLGRTRREGPAAYARAVGVVPQELALYEELTAGDNLALFGRLYGLGGRTLRDRSAEALAFVGLEDAARRRVRTLSGGQQRRVHLACALLHRPALLLLDEPTVGLDGPSRGDILERLGRLRDRGCALVLTTHRLDEAEQLCDRVGVLAGGRLAEVGTPAALCHRRESGRVLEAVTREPLDATRQRQLVRAAGPGLSVSAAGRSLRLEAVGAEALTRGLAAVLAAGVVLESVTTPPPSLERVLAGGRTAGEQCAVS